MITESYKSMSGRGWGRGSGVAEDCGGREDRFSGLYRDVNETHYHLGVSLTCTISFMSWLVKNSSG